MSYYNNEDARNLVLLDIENMKNALEVYDLIIPVVKRFDGKILNRRLETTLKEVCSKISVDGVCDGFRIEYCDWNNRSVQSVNADTYGYATTNYTKFERIVLSTYLCKKSYQKDDPRLMVDENGRIIADRILEALEAGKKILEAKIKRLEESLDRVEEWQKRMQDIKNQLDELNAEIPAEFTEYFRGLSAYISC